jgi:hypothetical protein
LPVTEAVAGSPGQSLAPLAWNSLATETLAPEIHVLVKVVLTFISLPEKL